MLKIKKSNFFIFFHILAVVTFVSLRKKIFYIFPQAMNVYNFHVDFITLYKYGYIHHIPRYLVVYPSIFLGELFDIDIHLVNTVYSMIIFCITIILWWRIIKKYRVRINLLTWILLVFFSIVIITFVNGRIIFAYFSEALLLYYFVEEKFQINFKFLIIFLFSSVSSGTMSVILIICFLSRKMLNNTARAKKLLRLFKFPIIIMIGYFFLIVLKKNLIDYSGNIFAMLQHGLFAILENLSIEMYVLLLIGLICFIYITILLKKKDELLFKFYIGSVIGVFFGFTAGSMMLPILLVYFLIIFNSKTIKRLEGDKNK